MTELEKFFHVGEIALMQKKPNRTALQRFDIAELEN